MHISMIHLGFRIKNWKVTYHFEQSRVFVNEPTKRAVEAFSKNIRDFGSKSAIISKF